MVRREDGAIVSVMRDMTERVRAVRQLRESEERFRGAFVHSAIGIALMSPEGRWLQVNAALCAILGYTEAELLATTFQALTVPEDLEANLDHLRRALAGEIDHYELQKRYLHKDGRAISVLLTVSLVRDPLGRPLYFVSQLLDISERIQAQQEVERLRLELTHSGRVALMGKLTASLAHELMQPIAAAVGNAEAGQQLLAADSADMDEIRAILADIVENCLRAANVVSGVRSLLRKEPKPRRLVDLNRLVAEVAEMMHSELILRQVRLVTRLDTALPEITGHAVELQQVILNLILNGADALGRIRPLSASSRLPRLATRRESNSRYATAESAPIPSTCGACSSPSSPPSPMASEWGSPFAQTSSMRTTAGCRRRTTRTGASPCGACCRCPPDAHEFRRFGLCLEQEVVIEDQRGEQQHQIGDGKLESADGKFGPQAALQCQHVVQKAAVECDG